MAYSLSLSVFSPDSSILEVAQVKSVRVRLKGDSWLSIYPGHAALIGEVLPGDLMYSAGELQARLALPSSIIKVSDNQITNDG